jgi:hypothetical protein
MVWDELKAEGVREDQVTRIYSELQPCSIPRPESGCDTWISKTFKKAHVTYSYEYGAEQASRDAGNAARRADFRVRFE